MKITTKFDLNQEVYPISQRETYEFIPCECCGGIGEITVSATGKERTCPECYGRRGKQVYVAKEWKVITKYVSRIGKIETEIYREEDHNNKSRISYMLEETGVGSGTIWYEEKLFATALEAQIECDKRNLMINQ